MHNKKIYVSVLSIILAFIFSLSLASLISAKTVTSHDFEVQVGNDNYVYALLKEVEHDGENKQQIYFAVKLNEGKETDESEPIYKYIWTHKFELYENGIKINEEVDEMPSKIDGEYEDNAKFYNKNSEEVIYFSKEGYLFRGYDIDESKEYKIKFYNSFTCIDCNEEYEYKNQILDVIELTLAFDSTAPSVENNISSIIDTSSNINGTVVNGDSFNVSYRDDESGIKAAYYLFTSNWYAIVGDVIADENVYEFESNENLKIEIESSSYGEGYLQSADFWGYYYITYYVYVIIIDNCDNIYVKANSFNLYIEKDKNDIEYIGSISEEGATRNVVVDIDSEYDTWYSFSTSSFELKSNIINKYSSSLVLGNGENGTYYLHIIQYDDHGNLLRFSRMYTLDSNAPEVDSSNSSIPIVNKTYKSVSLYLQFVDRYDIEGYYYSGSGVNKAYYLFSSEILNENEYSFIDEEYIIGSKLTLDTLIDGTYYIYFRVSDVVGNEAVYYYTYNMDVTPPSIEIIDYSDDDFATIDPYVNFNVIDSEATSYRCGWFLDGYVPSYSELILTCSENTNNIIDGNYEGKYSLWIYAEDHAGNSVYYNSPLVFVDRKGPTVNVVNEYVDDSYRYSNNISIIISDGLSTLKNTVKYGWFKTSEIVSVDMLTSTLNLNSLFINYPKGVYGTYNLYIFASDNLNNETFTKIPTTYYIDTDDVILTLYGDEKITVIKNKDYEEFGAYAYKKSNKNVKVDVKITHNVDTSKAGKYIVTYTAGEGELEQTLTRVVIVEEVNQYYILTGSVFIVGIMVSIAILIIRIKREKRVQ